MEMFRLVSLVAGGVGKGMVGGGPGEGRRVPEAGPGL